MKDYLISEQTAESDGEPIKQDIFDCKSLKAKISR